MILQCKGEPSREDPSLGQEKDSILVIKTTAFAGPMVKTLKEMFPMVTCVYNTRHILETIQSLVKVSIPILPTSGERSDPVLFLRHIFVFNLKTLAWLLGKA